VTLGASSATKKTAARASVTFTRGRSTGAWCFSWRLTRWRFCHLRGRLATRQECLAYVYAGSGTQSPKPTAMDSRLGQFVRAWDQRRKHVKAAAQATVASVRSNVAQARRDIGGAASNVVREPPFEMIQTVKDVGNFGIDLRPRAGHSLARKRPDRRRSSGVGGCLASLRQKSKHRE